ncbi:hypothetical protein L1987_71767 [Smallanthus sonchifolius]|uniref:Uncharacterized protein n=1 Tax=Smallanthus sonchifolius TaxID=185202 RepID=A0ACB9ASZ2_9ASTR|nr:hypothetical protein L1987_71767 [Smallanthus sonchifolius]
MALLHDSETKNPSLYSRKEKSLGVLCSKSIHLQFPEAVQSRRCRIDWIGQRGKSIRFSSNLHAYMSFCLKQTSDENYKVSQMCNFGIVVDENDSRGPSNSNSSYTDRYTKSSGSVKSDVISLDTAATALLGDVHDPTAMRTKVRRLYDIANVFSSMDLLEKTRHPESGKPSFRWLGFKGHPKTKSQTLDTNNSTRRDFGTDITNHSDLKRNRMDSLSGWSSKDVTVAMHRNLDNVKIEYDENITTQVQPARISKEFVFGPFTPASVQKVGVSGNKKLKQAQDWENLAETYRPQYRNTALSELFGHYVEAWKSWRVEADEKKPRAVVALWLGGKHVNSSINKGMVLDPAIDIHKQTNTSKESSCAHY